MPHVSGWMVWRLSVGFGQGFSERSQHAFIPRLIPQRQKAELSEFYDSMNSTQAVVSPDSGGLCCLGFSKGSFLAPTRYHVLACGVG
jgi:hypothetical protein